MVLKIILKNFGNMGEVKVELQDEIEPSKNICFANVYVKEERIDESVSYDLEDNFKSIERMTELTTAKELGNETEENNRKLENFEKSSIGIDTIKEEQEETETMYVVKSEYGEEATDDTKGHIPLINIENIKEEQQYPVDKIKEEEIERINFMKTEDNEASPVTKEHISLINIQSIKEEHEYPIDEIKQQEIEIMDMKTEDDEEKEDINNCVESVEKEKSHEPNTSHRTLHNSIVKRYILVRPGEKPRYNNQEHFKQLLTGKGNVYEKTSSRIGFLKTQNSPHTESTLYICKICHKTFTDIRFLERHFSIHAKEPYGCKICHRSFSQKICLERHLNVCDKTSSRIEYLKTQNLLHTGNTLYICKICYKTFTDNGLLERHLSIHVKEPYGCEICHRSFSQKTYLIRHRLVHYQEEPHDEIVSDETIAFKKRLKRNFQIYTGEKSQLS